MMMRMVQVNHHPLMTGDGWHELNETWMMDVAVVAYDQASREQPSPDDPNEGVSGGASYLILCSDIRVCLD